jgi:hypothetical protein
VIFWDEDDKKMNIIDKDTLNDRMMNDFSYYIFHCEEFEKLVNKKCFTSDLYEKFLIRLQKNLFSDFERSTSSSNNLETPSNNVVPVKWTFTEQLKNLAEKTICKLPKKVKETIQKSVHNFLIENTMEYNDK